jgi:hypothetical protein
MIRALYIAAIIAITFLAGACLRTHEWFGFVIFVAADILLFTIRLIHLWRTQ